QVHNVIAGVAPTDAANVGQVTQAAANAVATANAFTEAEFDKFSNQLVAAKKRANAGIAAAIASSDIPQAIHPGKGAVGMGVGVWGDQASFAADLSYRLNDDRTSFKASVNVTTDGQVGGGAGVGLEF